MKLRNTKVFFIIDRNLKIRAEVFNYEASLNKAFKTPFIITNISDEADPNIIRFQTTSLNSFSSLQVAQNKIVLETNYNDTYDSNFQLVSDYIKDKVKGLIDPLTKEKLIFIGIVSQFDNEMKVEDILPFIKQQTNFNLIDNNILELKYNYKKKYNEKYNLNIDVTPFTRLSAQLQAQGPFSARIPLTVESKGLQVKLDFNNNVKGSTRKVLDSDLVDTLFNDYSNLIRNNTLINFINGSIQ